MAKQIGILPLSGTIDNITFLQTEDGFQARKKTRMNAQRLANDPAFERTRENNAEFARAGKASKLFKDAFRGLLQNISDKRLISRLNTTMMKVVKADSSNDRGQRNVLDGETELIKGFEFNLNSKFGSVFAAAYTKSIDRVTGELSVTIPSFIPLPIVSKPKGCTHFRFVTNGAEIDFEKEVIIRESQSSDMLPVDMTPTAPISLINHVTPNSSHPLFLALGIEYYLEENGKMYPLKNGAFNALSVIEVSGE